MFKLNNMSAIEDIIEEDIRDKGRDTKQAYDILDRIHSTGVGNTNQSRPVITINRTAFSPVAGMNRAAFSPVAGMNRAAFSPILSRRAISEMNSNVSYFLVII
jgi:hypothetical protein